MRIAVIECISTSVEFHACLPVLFFCSSLLSFVSCCPRLLPGIPINWLSKSFKTIQGAACFLLLLVPLNHHRAQWTLCTTPLHMLTDVRLRSFHNRVLCPSGVMLKLYIFSVLVVDLGTPLVTGGIRKCVCGTTANFQAAAFVRNTTQEQLSVFLLFWKKSVSNNYADPISCCAQQE